MVQPIRRAGVIGAGVMGSAIAAHLANASYQVLLLDIVPPELKDAKARNQVASAGLEKALKAKPAAFMHKSAARLVRVGNIEDDLSELATCDIVIEAAIERLDIKRQLFERLDKITGENTIIASNTSGLRIRDMIEGRSERFRKHFLVLHFFNPVRYMKLLEVVTGPDTDPQVLARVRALGESMGKGIVLGKDTPNFVGNRIGIFAMMAAIHQMLQDGLSPEDVDAVTGEPMGHPKSASFRTGDIVGLDTFAHVADNCYQLLTSDEEREVFKLPEFIRAMLEKKLLGDKTKGGFYRKTVELPPQSGGTNKTNIETFDPKTRAYRAKSGDAQIREVTKALTKIEDPKERVKKLIQDPGKAGQFAWKVLSRTLAYSARRIGTPAQAGDMNHIADDVVAIDNAMKWGYNWELGPFETWDALGFGETLARMEKDGISLPESVRKMKASGAQSFYREDGRIYNLLKGSYEIEPQDARVPTVARRGAAPVLKNDGAEAWDLGDGVLGLTFKTKANSIDPDVISMLTQAVERAERDFGALLLHNDGAHFCVGANLFLVAMAAGAKEWGQIRAMVTGYQRATQRLKYARVPVVAAPFGMTLGGGLELCFACDGVQACAETYAGLVEVGVGLIPGGAGTLNMLWRALEALPEGMTVNTYDVVTQVFKNIAMARVATSAEEAKAFRYFRRTDGVSFDKARLVTEAKARAVGLANAGYHPPLPRAFTLPGESGIATLSMMVDTLVAGGYASAHDAKIARKLAHVLCGGVGGAAREVTEDEVLALECEAFVSLCGEPLSQERMQYMLMNNKPLRN